jgi:hypothetical protein
MRWRQHDTTKEERTDATEAVLNVVDGLVEEEALHRHEAVMCANLCREVPIEW